MTFPDKRTKIVCTIGPACHTEPMLKKMIAAGMNVARLNFSHGTHKDHAKLTNLVHSAAKKQKAIVAILQDLQGPKIRVGELPEKGIDLVAGKQIIFSTKIKPAAGRIPVTYPKMHSDVKPGQRLLLSDGLMDVQVKKVSGQDIYCLVGTGGHLTSHQGINMPETKISASSMSDKDKDDVEFGVKLGVDWIALSFVRSAKDIYDLKALIKKHQKGHGQPIRVLAKIEKREAVENMDEILEATDGIMVARGDLGVEIPAEDVPLIQKQLIEKALEISKPVIVATQMLDSMIRNPRPTRAEVSDVANAVIDHTDAVMLSGETATGKYPVQTVQTMARIIRKTESSHYDDLNVKNRKPKTKQVAVASLARELADESSAKLILVASLTGRSGRIVSSYRPELPIFVGTHDVRVCNQLALSWGVMPFLLPTCQNVQALISKSVTYLKKNRFSKNNDQIVVVAGQPTGISGTTNLVEMRTV